MQKKYLGQIDVMDTEELFLYRNSANSYKDLKKTLENVHPAIHSMIDGICLEKVTTELNDTMLKKNTKFNQIFQKYNWMQVTEVDNLKVMDDGKVYYINCISECSSECNNSTCEQRDRD